LNNIFRALLASAVLFTSLAWKGATNRIDPSPCVPSNGGGAGMLRVYQYADTTHDGGHIAWRNLLSLPTVPVSQITLVTDTTICRRAVNAFNTIFAPSHLPPFTAVNTIQYGTTRYIIGNESGPVSGEWQYEAVVDTAFSKVSISGR
jgi:hypothetical protein